MVRIVNGNIVEDDNRNGAGANAAPATGGTAFAGGSFLAHLAQPVEIYGYHTNYQMLAGLGLAVVVFGGMKWALLYVAVLYFLIRKPLTTPPNGAPPRPRGPPPNRSVDYATSGGTTSMNNDEQNDGSNASGSGFLSSFLGPAPSQNSQQPSKNSNSPSPFKKQGNIMTFGH